MKLEEAKAEFIQSWGALGSSWGINKTMAQIHALLLSTAEPMPAEEIMEKLQISRGNANMNIRALIDWGLVEKRHKTGDRREYFLAEKDMWTIFTRILDARRKKELAPIRKAIGNLRDIDSKDLQSTEGKHFSKMIGEIDSLAETADKGVNLMMSYNKSWFLETMLKFMR